jgi:lipid II:glycine glycyltransferase (peptidoglycan interpeptide bridge formation enzyme)
MNLKEISYEEYLNFALKNEYISIYQLPEWGDLKEGTGWNKYLLGLYDSKTLVGVSLLLEKKLPIKRSLFYAPRGFLFDVNDKKILKAFTQEVKSFLNVHKGFMLKVDPNVIYATYDSDGNDKLLVNKDVIDNFKVLGYKHLGFTKNFETMQPRFLCRFNIKKTYEDTLNSFSKATRKNIEKLDNLGVKTRKIDIDEIEEFVSILKCCGQEKNFIIRNTSYYKKMYELMNKYINLYITYIDTEEYYNKQVCLKNELLKKQQELKKEMTRVNVGKKLKDEEIRIIKQLEKIDENINEAKGLMLKGKTINIGALMSIFIGNEGITFMSGTDSLYRKFNPKYSYYSEHIKDCIKLKKDYCNFYGISGDLDKSSKYYSIYEIKKGFNPRVIELVGEFDLITNKFWYFSYKVALKGYKLLKKLK